MNSIHIHLYQGKQELKLHTQWLHGRDFFQFPVKLNSLFEFAFLNRCSEKGEMIYFSFPLTIL